MGLAFLFKETRDLFQANQSLLTAVSDRDRIIRDLETQLVTVSTSGPTVIDLMKRYQEEVLAEAPFPDGKIPEHLWLTPEDDEFRHADR